MSDTAPGRKRAAVAAAATAAIGSAAAPAIFPAPAWAAHPSQSCPGNTLCMWREFNFAYPNGPVVWFYPGLNPYEGPHHPDYRYYRYSSDTSAPLDNTVSSVWNNSNRWIKVCQLAYCDGPFNAAWGICVAPGGAAPNLSVADGLYGDDGNGGKKWNNAISAHYSYATRPDYCYTTIDQPGCSM
jgi:hypothetical protein